MLEALALLPIYLAVGFVIDARWGPCRHPEAFAMIGWPLVAIAVVTARFTP